MIKGHGADYYLFDNIKVDFSSNIYPAKVDYRLIEFLKNRLSYIDKYPEADASSLSRKIENFYKLEENSVIVTNGAVEAFYLIANSFQNSNSTIYVPSFSEYEDACKINNHNIDFVNDLKQVRIRIFFG